MNHNESTILPPSELSICESFQAACERGESPRIEDFLAGCDDAEKSQLLAELLRREVRFRQSQGDTLPVNDYRRRFAEHSNVLREAFGDDDDGAGIVLLTDSVQGIVNRLEELKLISTELHQVLTDEIETNPGQLTVESLCDRLSRQRAMSSFQLQVIRRGDVHRLVLGDYVLIDQIGQGGMGVVYRARQIGLNRIVALKTRRSPENVGEAAVVRFRQEAESAARLSHPGIVPVHAFGESSGIHFLAMGFVEGGSLADRLRETTISARESATLLQKIASAMDYAHREGVFHRDLKPANILISQDGEPRITDFGLARMADRESQTLSGDILGTPGYMPPEQAMGRGGEAREAADIYSMGAVLYHCLTGHPPFRGETVMATLKLVVEQPPVAPRQFNQLIPEDLETICLKCLEKDPQQRYLSSGELAMELGRFLRGEPILARRLSRVKRMARWCQRNPVVASLSAVAVLLLLIGSAVSTYFAVLATRRAAIAEEGSRIAVETLEAVVFTAQEELQGIAAARDARTKILKLAMKELETLSTQQIRPDRVDVGTAAVLVRYTVIIMEIGEDDELGNMQVARQNLLKACEIYERCSEESVDNERIETEWALALMKLADVSVDLKTDGESQRYADDAVSRYRSLNRKEPDTPVFSRNLANALCIQGDCLTARGDYRGAQTIFLEAAGIARLARQQHPDDLSLLEVLMSAIDKQVDAARRLGQIDSAAQMAAEYLSLNETYLAAAPTDSERLYSMSFADERLAEIEREKGDLQLAANYYEKEIDIMLKAVKADPENQKYLQEVSVPMLKFTGIVSGLGQSARAEAARKRIDDVVGALPLH